MDRIIAVVGTLPRLTRRVDDDFADRLSHWYTTATLTTFAIVVTSKQFVGDAINCWVPAHFTSNHEEYANNFCWIRNTYYHPFDVDVPRDAAERQRSTVHYYQWVPMILLVQALLFHLPVVVWRAVVAHSGIDVGSVVECGRTFAETELVHSRETMLRYMTKQMDRYLSSHLKGAAQTDCTISLKHCFSRSCFRCCGREHGNKLIIFYLFVKLLFIVNVVGQLFALNLFLGQGYHVFGIDVLRSLIAGRGWTTTPRFPRVTLCDFKVRRFVHVQEYTVQCVLPINLFNEKIFLFVWFWLVFVAAATVASFALWSLRFAFRLDRRRYVKKHLQLLNKMPDEADRRRVVRFVDDYLRQDGVFVLRLVGHNTNAITVTELVCSLWEDYRKRHLVAGDDTDEELSQDV